MEAYLLVSCPYNPAHRISRHKFMNHVTKCKKTANAKNKTECPLDNSHIVDCDHLKKHIATCPSLGKLVNEKSGHIKQKRDIVVDTYESSENWNEEPEVPSYDPMEASAERPVLRCIPGLSKAEKKKFRESERIRISNLMGEINNAKTTSLLEKDTEQELPLRPPCSTSAILYDTENSQDVFVKSQINNNLDASTQIESTHEFQNLSYRTLYDELAPEYNDTNQQLEHSLYSTDMGASAQDYFQYTSGEKKNLPFFNQNHKTKEEVQLNEIFNVNNLKKEKNEYENTFRSSEQVTDKFLALKNSDVKKIESVKEVKKLGQNDTDLNEKGLNWNDIFNKFNDRLTYLTDIQNAAAEESAQLLKQLKELKLREESILKE